MAKGKITDLPDLDVLENTKKGGINDLPDLSELEKKKDSENGVATPSASSNASASETPSTSTDDLGLKVNYKEKPFLPKIKFYDLPKREDVYKAKETDSSGSESTTIAPDQPVRNYKDVLYNYQHEPQGLVRVKDWEDVLYAPGNAMYEGIKGGIEKIQSGSLIPSPDLTIKENLINQTKVAQGFLDAGFGLANAVPGIGPGIAAFNVVAAAGQKVLPKTTDWILNAPAKVADAIAPEFMQGELGQSAMGAAGILWQGLLIHSTFKAGKVIGKTFKGIDEMADKIKNGEPLNEADANELAGYIPKVGKDNFKDALQETVSEDLHPDLRPQFNKLNNLKKDYDNIVAAHGDDAASPLLPEIEKANKDFETQKQNIEQLNKVNGILGTELTPESKAIYEKQRDEIQKNIDDLKPKEVSENKQEIKTVQPPVTKDRTGESKVSDLNGKQVSYNGKQGTLNIDEGGKVTVETDNVIHEINATPDEYSADHNIKEVTKEEPKYDVQIKAENEANVNGINYKIITDDKGNVIGLDNGQNVIKNEKMLVATEIERNKILDNKVNELPQDEVRNEIRDHTGLTDQEHTLVEGILNNNMTDKVDVAIEKLSNKEPLTDDEKLQVELWAMDAVERLDNAKGDIGKDGHEYVDHLKNQVSNILESIDNEKVGNKNNGEGFKPQSKKETSQKQRRKSKKELKPKEDVKASSTGTGSEVSTAGSGAPSEQAEGGKDKKTVKEQATTAEDNKLAGKERKPGEQAVEGVSPQGETEHAPAPSRIGDDGFRVGETTYMPKPVPDDLQVNPDAIEMDIKGKDLDELRKKVKAGNSAPIVVEKGTGKVIDGNKRLLLARDEGVPIRMIEAEEGTTPDQATKISEEIQKQIDDAVSKQGADVVSAHPSTGDSSPLGQEVQKEEKPPLSQEEIKKGAVSPPQEGGVKGKEKLFHDKMQGIINDKLEALEPPQAEKPIEISKEEKDKFSPENIKAKNERARELQSALFKKDGTPKAKQDAKLLSEYEALKAENEDYNRYRDKVKENENIEARKKSKEKLSEAGLKEGDKVSVKGYSVPVEGKIIVGRDGRFFVNDGSGSIEVTNLKSLEKPKSEVAGEPKEKITQEQQSEIEKTFKKEKERLIRNGWNKMPSKYKVEGWDKLLKEDITERILKGKEPSEVAGEEKEPKVEPPPSILDKDTDLKGNPKEGWMENPKWFQDVEIKNKLLVNIDAENLNEVREKARKAWGDYTKRHGLDYGFVPDSDIKITGTIVYQKAIKEGKYEQAIKEGRMTASDAKSIIESAGLEVPKDILDASSPREPVVKEVKGGGEPKAEVKPEPKEGEKKPNPLADHFRNKTKDNPNAPKQSGFGLPKEWNDKINNFIADRIEAGDKLVTAIAKGIKFLDDNLSVDWDKVAFYNDAIKSAPKEFKDKTDNELINEVGEQFKEVKPKVKTYDDPEMTKMANAINDAYIEGKYGTDALDSVIRKLQDTNITKIYEEAKAKIKKGLINIDDVRKRVMNDQYGSEQDQGVLIYDAAELKGRERELVKAIKETENADERIKMQDQLIDVQNKQMDNALASKSIGRSGSNIMRLRQVWVDKSANIADMMDEYMAGKGLSKLTEEQQKYVKAQYNKLHELELKMEDLKEKESKTREENIKLQKENEILKTLQDKAKKQRKADRGLKTEAGIRRSNERVQAAKDRMRARRGQLSAGINPEDAADIALIAKEKLLVQPGLKFAELVSNVYDEIKDVIPGFTEKDVIDHLGYTKESKPQSQQSKIFQKIKGVAKLEAKTEAGDFSTKQKKIYEKSDALKAAEREYALARLEWDKGRRQDLMEHRPTGEKIADNILRWQRFSVLMYPSTIVKLAAVVGHGLILKPIKFAAQALAYGLTPKSITEKQDIWGKPRISSIAKYYGEFFRNFSLENLKEHFGSVDAREAQYGKPFIYDEWKAAKGWMEIPGRSHGYIKSFIKNPEFEFAHNQLSEHYIEKMGDIEKQLENKDLTPEKRTALEKEREQWDVTKDEVQDRMGRLALEHGKWSILMNDNKFVDKFRQMTRNSPFWGTLAKSELPILKIPTNYVGRAFAVKYGLIQAIIGKRGWTGEGKKMPGIVEMMYKGTEDLTPEQADLFGRVVTMGSIGATFFTAGYLMKNQIKENEDGSFELFGQHVSKNLSHVPEYESIFSGAKAAQLNKGKKHYDDYIWNFAMADLDVGKKAPFMTMLKYGFFTHIAEIMMSKSNEDALPVKLTDAFAKKMSDMVEPGLMRQAAGAFDTKKPGFHPLEPPIKRWPKSKFKLDIFMQNFELGIPGLRKNVPKSKPKKKFSWLK